ncbi:hypothetical protein [Ferruginibacter sp.]
MNASEFISKLNSLAFDESNLHRNGFSDNYSKSLIEAFYPQKTNENSLSNNIIIQLIEEYKCACISIASSISFNEEVSETDRFVLIGWVFGEDLLAIDKSNAEIVILAYWDYDLVTFHCAANSDKFLEAFLIHGICPLDIIFEMKEDQWIYNINKANEAATAAGGGKYLKFWMALYPTDIGKSDETNKGRFLN